MTISAFGHSLETLYDGATGFCAGRAHPVPLTALHIDIRILAGLALVTTTRSLTNREEVPIEAILTFPIGFDAVVTSLTAEVGGRRLTARAQARDAARTSYEAAIDAGKLAVLHEEVLRGVHMLSVANLGPGAEALIVLEQVLPLSALHQGALLRLPQTVGQLYGASPLMPADDLTTGPGALAQARLRVTSPLPTLADGRDIAGTEIPWPLDRAVELTLPKAGFGTTPGLTAEGPVSLTLSPLQAEGGLDLAILFDRSGSTQARVGRLSLWQAMTDGLRKGLAGLGQGDRVVLAQFDDACQVLGAASGPEAAHLTDKLKGPNGGTALGAALETVLDFGARDILVMTDGQTWAHEVDRLSNRDARISAVLVGPGSLDATIGHLVAMKGGQLHYAPGADVAAALLAALTAARAPRQVAQLIPGQLTCTRGGVRLQACWTEGAPGVPDAIGRYAAALKMALLPPDQALDLALSHDLCSASTSLILVDDQGETQSLLGSGPQGLDRGEEQVGACVLFRAVIAADPGFGADAAEGGHCLGQDLFAMGDKEDPGERGGVKSCEPGLAKAGGHDHQTPSAALGPGFLQGGHGRYRNGH